MNRCVLIIVLLLFCACSNDKPIRLYAINMMYACECPRYRVFMVEDIDAKNRLIESNIDLDKNIILNKEISRVIELEKPQKNSFIGVDLELIFNNKSQELEFSKNEGIFPTCNIYYLEGKLRKKIFAETVLFVDSYKIIPKTPTCISHKIL